MMAHVLRSTAGFDDVRLLIDPSQPQLAEAIELLFAGRERDDLALLYFSGHGMKDERGRLYLGVSQTKKHPSGELVRSSAVSCRHVHDAMTVSRSQRQVVILDCCFSAAFAEGMSAKDAGHVDLRGELGGQGRAVLTSSSSTQFSFDSSDTGMSMYTQFLVHGIASGEADLNHDGVITVDELHEYAKSRVCASQPTMSPQILPLREGYSIVVSSAKKTDPARAYAAKVREVADPSGVISKVAARVLALHRQQLGIDASNAREIEEVELGSRRTRTSGVDLLRDAVFDARSRGRVGAERGLLNELRIVSNLSEADLEQLLAEPIKIQRRKVQGWRYWPQRAFRYCVFAVVIGVAMVVAMKVAAVLEGCGASSPSKPQGVTPRPRDPSPPSARPPSREPDPEPPSSETPTPTNLDISSTSYVLQLASTRDIDRARMLARAAAQSELGGEALRPQIVHQKRLYRVIVGPYGLGEADDLHEDARVLFYNRGLERSPGAYVRSMATWCPTLSEPRDDVRWCLEY